MRPYLQRRCYRLTQVFRRNYTYNNSGHVKFSLGVTGTPSKDKLINSIEIGLRGRQSLINGPETGDLRDFNATILASQQYAQWLEDESFVSRILRAILPPEGEGRSVRQVDMLSGVVDGVKPLGLCKSPQAGFSVLLSPTVGALPGLWDPVTFCAENERDRGSTISFLANPLVNDSRPLEVTLPLANTIFQNGRQSTLFASRWQPGGPGNLNLAMKQHKKSQPIAPTTSSVEHASPVLPLLPVSSMRRIAAGFGNIVRQVEVDGAAAPASRELESIIPQILSLRSKHYGNEYAGPMGVWAWVIPPHVARSQVVEKLNVFGPSSAESESQVALSSLGLFSELLSSGCRLHKILSGGGGWGAKQGLLSLDPETTSIQPEDNDDVEMFIRSFKERNNADNSEGLVTPGSYVLFCIEPVLEEADKAKVRLSSDIGFGVASIPEDEKPAGSELDKAEFLSSHFGAVSTSGLFLRTLPNVNGTGTTAQATDGLPQFTTKISVPGAFMSTGAA